MLAELRLLPNRISMLQLNRMQPPQPKTLTAPPVFIRANFTLIIQGKEYSFLNYPISSYGISGLKWPHFHPIDHVGEIIEIKLDVLAATRFSLATTARITAESTSDVTYLGAKFNLNNNDHLKLITAIKKEGTCPTHYFRQFPRIPARQDLATIPLRAIVKTANNELIAFDLANLSPNGVLLHTENPKAGLLLAGSRIQVQIEPRGSNFEPFQFAGLICRVMLEKNSTTQNLIHLLGIRITHLDEKSKNNFLSVLRTVINELQN